MPPNIIENIVNQAKGVLDEAKLETEAKRLLDSYRAEIGQKSWDIKPRDFPAGNAILDGDPQIQMRLVFQLIRRGDYRLDSLTNMLSARALPWTSDMLERLLAVSESHGPYQGDWGGVLRQVQRFVEQGNALTPKMRSILGSMQASPQGAQSADGRKFALKIGALLGDDMSALPAAGEAWADVAIADVAAMSETAQAAWKRLFGHAQNSESAKPNAAWRKEAKACVSAVGKEEFGENVTRWFGEVTTPAQPTGTYGHNAVTERNISLLKGLAWICADQPDVRVARGLSRLLEGSLKKLPGLGPWAVRSANAAIWALTEMDCAEAVSQLGRLKTKVTFRTAINLIEKGLETAARRAGVTKADLEDMSVPVYGFDNDGVRREIFGTCSAVASIAPTGDIAMEWFAANGKPVKSVPAEVRKSYPAELKEFKADVDAAGKALTAQKTRFDSFYLPERVWPLKTWRERFIDHPPLATIAKRLIWHVSDGDNATQGIWDTGKNGLVDARDESIPWLQDESEVRLWHPIGFDVDVVLRWREYLQQHGIVQPFKQAHREVYILTEAELNTRTYSNRFAGHILKQHQMNALAAQRGWKNKLRLMVDDQYPPASKELPYCGIRAEFWIEGIGDTYGTDTTDSGTFLYLSTDQVRFYAAAAPENYAHAAGGGYGAGWGAQDPAASLPLTEVPALVFSEVMRDIDLFVGVSSVGNDPAWQDGGPQGRHPDYWANYSFGELSATAQTRREVLTKLLPRLKIASRCSLADRFLIVQGDLRTYKIHLGSGNILMEPNDQYLCIVQDRSIGSADVPVTFLPFEGDQRLALILSKAFLLADDRKITDPTITRQIVR